MSSLGRSRIVVASSSEVMLQSLWRTTQVFCRGRDVFEFSPDYPDDAVHAVGPESIAAFLEAFPAEVIARTVCVLDLSAEPTPLWRVVLDVHSLRPTWLAARFPEVFWIFIVRGGGVPEDITRDAQRMHFVDMDDLSSLSTLLSRHAGGFRPWFDTSGLRASALLAKPAASTLETGLHGMVFDEEIEFAVFNAYFLYRQGIPTRMVATAAEFHAVKGLGETNQKYVVLEDVELNFEDAQLDDKKLFLPEPLDHDIESCLNARLSCWGVKSPGDQTITARVFVSSSRVSNRPSVVKPFGGLYDRSLVACLPPRSAKTLFDRVRALLAFLPRQFIRNGCAIEPEDTALVPGHSAPGSQQAVAAKLLARVRAYRASANDTVFAVHAALLALEAERLLGHSTYAMAVEALTARHVLEAVAESAFAGAADDLEVRKRADDLQKEVVRLVFHLPSGWTVIAALLPWAKGARDNWIKLHKRCVQVSNGMLECVGRLREIYQRFSKVDEEEEALREIRWWRLAVFLLKQSIREGRKPEFGGVRFGKLTFLGILEFVLRLACGLPWAYFNFVLRPGFLIFFTTSWVLLFGLLFFQLSLSGGLLGTQEFTLFDWIRHSLVTFLSLQQGIVGDPKPEFAKEIFANREGYSIFWNLTAMEMFLGYLHLPIFITLLIQKFARR